MWWECCCWAQRGVFDCREDQSIQVGLSSGSAKFRKLNPVGKIEDIAKNLQPCDSRSKSWLWGEFLIVVWKAGANKQDSDCLLTGVTLFFQCLPLDEQSHGEFLLYFQPGTWWDERCNPWANGQWLQELWKHHSVAAKYHQLHHCSTSVFQGKAFQATCLHKL